MSFFDILGIVSILTGIFAAFEYYEARESSQAMKAVTVIWCFFILIFSQGLLSPGYLIQSGAGFVYGCVFHVVLFVGVRLYLGPVRTVQKIRYDARKRVEERLDRERERRFMNEHIEPIPRVVSRFPTLSKSEEEALVGRLMQSMHKTKERE